MTFPRLAALSREWEQRPPLAWIIPPFLGHKPPRKIDTTNTAPATAAALDAMFPNGRFRGS